MLSFVISKCSNLKTNIEFAVRLCSSNVEEWVDAFGFDRYQVSSYGRVKSKRSNRVMKINYERAKSKRMCAQLPLQSNDGPKNVNVARLVLMSFEARKDMHSLFALHKDGDRFNNRIDNLEWSSVLKRVKQFHHKSPMKLESKSNDTLYFDTLKECQAFLVHKGFPVNQSLISNLCAAKRTKFGYRFTFQNPAKYVLTVTDLQGEDWKLMQRSKRKLYWISNMGRIKSNNASGNGREQLLSLHFTNGYYFIRPGLPLYSRLVHRMVAKHFVDNPNNYSMIDHLDTDSLNNKATNLRWVKDSKENHDNEISRRNKSIDVKVQQICLRDGSVVKEWPRASVAARECGLSSSHILTSCRSGGKKIAYGFQWKFSK